MIDVIIPAYNSYKTIERTLMSLGFQRASKQLVVTIIDDGSEDTYDYLEPFFKKFFKGFNIIRLEENHGVGYARQIAIKNTKMPWIYFLDSDDVMNGVYAFNHLARGALSTPDAAMVFGKISCELSPYANNVQAPDLFCDEDGNMQYLHGKLYSRVFIMQHGLTFPDTRCNEDIAFNLAYFTLCDSKQIVRMTHSVCTTLYNSESITRNKKSTRVYSRTNVNEVYDSYRACLHAFKQVRLNLGNNLSPTSCSLFIEKYVNLFLNGVLSNFETDEERELYHMIITLFYRDIVKPIMNVNGISRVLDEEYVKNGPFNYWGDAAYTRRRPKISDWSEGHLRGFDQSRFYELQEKFLTGRGYLE